MNRHHFAKVAIALAIAFTASASRAWQLPEGVVRGPYGLQATGDASASQNAPPASTGGGARVGAGTGGGHHHYHGGPNAGWSWGGYGWSVPGYGGWGYGNPGAWAYGYQPGYYGPWSPGYGSSFYYNSGNIYLPGQPIYGGGYYAAPPVIENDPAAEVLAEAERRRHLALRASAASVELARKHLEVGDVHFAQQRYRNALTHYEDAVKAAPDLAEAYFRRGQAEMAMNRVHQAARSFRQGLLLDPVWPQRSDRLDTRYGDNQVALRSHLDQLARMAADHPDDADPLFLLGLYVYFGGQKQRSLELFRQAAEVSADDSYLQGFFDEIARDRQRRDALAAPAEGPRIPRLLREGEVEL